MPLKPRSFFDCQHPQISRFFFFFFFNDTATTEIYTLSLHDALPISNYAFVVPDLCNDAHDCSLATADAWLKTNIDPLMQSASFQQDGLLIIVFDEAGGDNTMISRSEEHTSELQSRPHLVCRLLLEKK